MSLIHNVSTIINQRKRGRQTGFLRYPNNLGSHAVILNFKKYEYGGTIGGSSSINESNSVILPIPMNLEDSFSVNVGQQSLGLPGGLAAEAVTTGGKAMGDQLARDGIEAIKSMFGGSSDSGGNDTSNAFSNWKIASGFFARAGLDNISPGIGTGVDISQGYTLNPHMTLNFDGVNLKNHAFSWKFAPESEADSEQLRRVINTIRRASLPTYKGERASDQESGFLDRALLSYPDLVDIFFVGIDQRYFYHFKPCMIQSFTTNFSPDGLSFVKGGKPTAVMMTMNLSEARIHTKDDYSLDDIYDSGADM